MSRVRLLDDAAAWSSLPETEAPPSGPLPASGASAGGHPAAHDSGDIGSRSYSEGAEPA